MKYGHRIVRAAVAAVALVVAAGASAQISDQDEDEEQAAPMSQIDADICTRCDRELKNTNADCETMTGLDWKICRDAAEVAYRRCSVDC